jgi:hypothetical protein
MAIDAEIVIDSLPATESGIVQFLEDGPVVYGIGFRLGS